MDTLISEFFGKYRGKWKSDGESLYPILRLMRPDLDGARVYGLKEAKLAEVWHGIRWALSAPTVFDVLS